MRDYCANSPQNGCPFFQDLGLFLLRLWVGQEFLYAACRKLQNGAFNWFGELDFPFPHNLLSADVNWFLAGWGEFIFGLMLIVGFGTRLAALALMYITWVAIYSVHFDFGLAGWNKIESDAGLGFKVPLMLMLMQFVILAQGAGRWAADRWLAPFWAQMAGCGDGLKDK